MSAPFQQIELNLSFAPTIIPTGRSDGAYTVIPGKPVLAEDWLTTKQVAKLLGYSRQRVVQMATALGARQIGKGCKLRFPASKVLRFREMRRL